MNNKFKNVSKSVLVVALGVYAGYMFDYDVLFSIVLGLLSISLIQSIWQAHKQPAMVKSVLEKVKMPSVKMDAPMIIKEANLMIDPESAPAIIEALKDAKDISIRLSGLDPDIQKIIAIAIKDKFETPDTFKKSAAMMVSPADHKPGPWPIANVPLACSDIGICPIDGIAECASDDMNTCSWWASQLVKSVICAAFDSDICPELDCYHAESHPPMKTASGSVVAERGRVSSVCTVPGPCKLRDGDISVHCIKVFSAPVEDEQHA